MKLQFDSLAISYFKCFQEEQVLNLQDFLPGLHFLRGRNEAEPRLGSNGAGKTSIWDALCWCLYGKTPDNLRNPDIKPWYGSQRTRVILNFKTDEEVHELVRTANPNSVTLDGDIIGQEQINDIVGMHFDTFTHTILLGQGRPLFYDLKPSEKMSLFVDVLDLNKWDKRAEAASGRASKLQRESDRLQGELTGVENSLEQIEGLLESTNQNMNEWIEARKQQRLEQEERLTGFKERRDKLEPLVEQADVQYDGALTELKAIQKDLSDLETEYGDVRAEEVKHLGEIRAKEIEVDRLYRGIQKLGRRCPTCNQTITEESLGKHKKEVEKQIASLQEEIKVGIPGRIKSKLKKLDQERHALVKSERSFQTKADKARDTVYNLTPELQATRAKIQDLEERLKEWETEGNPYRTQLADLRKEKKTLEAQKEDIEEDIGLTGRRFERAKFWVKGFKEVRLMIVEEVLQELELTTNAMLPESGLMDWSVKWSIEKETKSGTISRGLNLFIQSPKNQEPVKWESWSGGEGQRLRIVGALALSEVLLNYAGVQPDLEILDEPTQHLSVEGVNDACDFLADRAQQLERLCFYVDHQSVESTRFSSVLTVVHKDGGAVLMT